MQRFVLSRSGLAGLLVALAFGLAGTTLHAQTAGEAVQLPPVREDYEVDTKAELEAELAAPVHATPSIVAPAANTEQIMRERCGRAEYADAPFCAQYRAGDPQ